MHFVHRGREISVASILCTHSGTRLNGRSDITPRSLIVGR